MILLTVDEIVSLHSKLIVETGGLDGIRDVDLLESSIFNAYSSYYDFVQYPTVVEKSARLCYSLISNHSFIDGNKRIGILVMLMTLRLNDISINYTQKELINLGLSVANGVSDYEKILNWIKNHII